MSARISIDLDETPDATIDVTTGADHSNVWVKLRGKAQPTGEQERYEVWLTPAQALTLKSTLGGAVVSVKCDDREHAEWLRDTAIRKGIPKSALKVRVS
jgi:hypothetical protein